MRNGCAGFLQKKSCKIQVASFYQKEIEVRPREKKILTGKSLCLYRLKTMMIRAFEALRQGDISACFGAHFNGIEISDALKLPGGRMKLINRVLKLDPIGGRF